MELLHLRCAGLDVHKDTVVACVRLAEGKVKKEVRTFSTMTRALMELSAWLAECGVTHVAMEATGVYWKPIWHILERDFELILANAQHIKAVPGRKTDVNDAMWIAELLAHGLIRSSFVPPQPIQELRDMTRTRKQLGRTVTQHTQRIQKVLEDANLKVASVLSSILGGTGRAILEAIVAGESDPEVLAALAKGRAKTKRADLIEALRGRITPHHRTMVKLNLEVIEALEKAIGALDDALGKALAPIEAQAELLTTMPGVSEVIARGVVAELGVDMSRFATADHAVSWAGMCPRSDESAGKRRSTRLRKGSPWLKTALVTAAWAAVRKKESYLKSLFQRIKARRGAKKAIIAVAASMLRSMYHMLKNHEPYKELGAQHFAERNRTQTAHRLVKRLKQMGYTIELSAQPA
jgi:transposase